MQPSQRELGFADLEVNELAGHVRHLAVGANHRDAEVAGLEGELGQAADVADVGGDRSGHTASATSVSSQSRLR